MPPAYEVLLLNTAIPQIQAAQTGDTYVVPRDIAINATAIISANSATDALRITQTGAGNAILVEDSTNPDSTPFVVTAAGDVGIGTSSPSDLFQLNRSSTTAVVQFITNTGGEARIGVENASGTGILSGAGAYDTVIRTKSGTGVSFGIGYSAPAMRLDSSGNLGLGVTPSGGTYPALEFGSPGIIRGDGDINVASNAFFNAGWKYKNPGFATLYLQTSGQNQWYTAPSGTAGNAISWTQAMTLDASGNLGVGGTSGGNRLRVTSADNSGTTKIARFESNNAVQAITIGFGGVYSSGGGLALSADSTNPLTFETNSTERARITSDGDFLVGKQSASATVAGAWIDQNGYISSTKSTSTNADNSFVLYSTGASAYRFYVGMGGTISATNTTISAISDQRLKENIRDLDVGLDAVLALKPRKFDWKAGKGKDKKDDRGFIAQEFEQVFPDLVDEWLDPAPEGETPYKSVRQDLIPVLVKAIQEQQAMIEELKAKVAATGA